MSTSPKAPPRLDAADRWFRVSQGDIDPAALEWLKGAAASIHAAALLPTANARRLALEKATGIFGKADINAYMARIAVHATPNSTPLQQRAVLAGMLNLSQSTPEAKDATRKRVERARRK
jgi:hypothetical protein